MSGTLAFGKDILTMKAGPLQFSLDDRGVITSLKDTVGGHEYIVNSPAPYLLKAGPEFNDRFMQPSSAVLLKKVKGKALIQFNYDFGAKITVKVVNRGKYLSFEIVKVASSKRVAAVRWGVIRVAMHGPIARWIAMARSNDFSIAFLPLSENTTGMGNNGYAANFTEKGTELFLEAYNQETTKSLSSEFKTDVLDVQPLPGETVKGSKIAIAGCKVGRNNELNLLESIELSEGLPHPTYKGVWVKRSRAAVAPSLWIGHDQRNMDSIIEMAKSMSVGNIVRFQGFYKNWGHFEVDKNVYPGGWKAVKVDADKCRKNGINLGFYSLTYFTKPMSGVEPYIAPVPDKRLAKLKPKLHLVAPLTANQKDELRVKFNEQLYDVWNKRFRHWIKVLQVDNEMIEAKEMKKEGDVLVFRNLTRGAFKGVPAAHAKNAKVVAMVAGGYHNLFPGTISMHVEEATTQAKRILHNDLGLVILDGFGEATGHGALAKNRFMDVFNKTFKNRDLLITASPSQSIYNWHSISFFSWGEYELYKGFRGTMIDYRLKRQIELESNLIPKKLGQYYPDDATAEDIEWLMNLIAGWDSGVDFSFSLRIKKNPEYAKICSLISLWEEARLKNVFNDRQKMWMRQTDTIYSLTKVNGKWNLKFKKFSYDKKMKLLPSSVFKVKPLENGKVKKCTAIWRQTHDPGIHLESAISDDLTFNAADKSATWEVTYPMPADNRSGTRQKLQFILRVDAAPGVGIKDIKITVDDHSLFIPTVLKAGEYVANPHLIHKLFVYNAKTNIVKREVYIPQFNPYWFLPEIKKGQPAKISVSCETDKPGKSAKVTLNLVLRQELYEGCRR